MQTQKQNLTRTALAELGKQQLVKRRCVAFRARTFRAGTSAQTLSCTHLSAGCWVAKNIQDWHSGCLGMCRNWFHLFFSACPPQGEKKSLEPRKTKTGTGSETETGRARERYRERERERERERDANTNTNTHIHTHTAMYSVTG